MLTSQKVIDAINEQIGYEFSAELQYYAIAAHFAAEALPQLSQHFFQQAEEEKGHALRFIKYVVDAGGRVVIPAIDAPKSKFKTAKDAVKLSLDQEVKVTHQINALVELARLRLEPIVGAALPHPGEAGLDRDVEEDREIGREAAGGRSGHGADDVEGDPTAVTLIGQGRVDVPVRDHGPPGFESRPHDLGHVLRPVGEIEEHLGRGVHVAVRRVEEEAPDRASQGRPAGLPGEDDTAPEGGGEARGLGALAAPLHSLERDERHSPPF